MTITQRSPITVGVDPSLGGETAVLWGGLQAHVRRCPLHLVSAYHWSMSEPWASRGDASLADAMRRNSLATLDRACEQVRLNWPDVVLRAEAIEGRPAHLLSAQSESQLVVIGSRQRGDDAPIGTVATAVAAHARRPVIVVPPGWTPPQHGCVVAGLDPRRDCTGVVSFALNFAHLAQDAVRIVVCTHSDAVSGFPARLGDEVDRVAHRFPDVTVHKQIVIGNPAGTLTTVAQGEDLLVLGRHCELGPLRRLFGSVGASALQSATCPVSVVPDAPTAEPVVTDDTDRNFWATDFGLTYRTR